MQPNLSGQNLSEQKSVTVFGGSYTASHNEDGTWDIYSVPIMSELPKGAKDSVPYDIGREWLEKTMRNHLAIFERASGRMHPLNLRHHDRGLPPMRAGYFLPKRVEQFSTEGRQSWTMFADLVKIPQEIFSQIEEGRWPYSSPEVAKWDENIIFALSLLDTEPSFFEYPPITIGAKIEEVPESEFVATHFDDAGPAVGLITLQRRATVLFHYGSDPKPVSKAVGDGTGTATLTKLSKDGEPSKQEGANVKDEEKTEVAAKAEEAKPDQAAVKTEEKPAVEKKDNSEAAKKGSGDSGAEPSEPASLAAKFDVLLGKLTALFSLLGLKEDGTAPNQITSGGTQMTDGKEKAAETGPVQPEQSAQKAVKTPEAIGAATKLDATPAAEPVKKLEADPNAAEVTKLSARTEALEAQKAARDKSDAERDMVDGALKALEGWPQRPSLRESLVKFAKQGSEHLTLFVKEYQEAVPKDPISTLAQLEHMQGRALEMGEPDEVKTYFSKSPDHAAAARESYADFVALRKLGYSLTLAQHLSQDVEARVEKIRNAGKK